MSKELSLFEQIIFEAPGDEDDGAPPDMPGTAGDAGGADSSTPEEMPDIGGEDDGAPPDIGDAPDNFDSSDAGFEDEEGAGGEEQGSGESEEVQAKNLKLDEKISSILNMNLYQQFLSMLNTITGQISTLKDNADILYSIANNNLEMTQKSLKKLEENVRLYMQNVFTNSDYSKNLLFFNKCLNLLKLLSESFNQNVSKGIKSAK